MFWRSYYSALVIVACAAFFGTSWAAFYIWANPGYEPIAFTKAKWADGTPETRGRMARDLLHQHTLVGLNREDVRDLLGPPDEDQRELNRSRYYLGNMGRNPTMLFFWGYSLLIKFNSDGVATEASIAD